MNSIIIVSSNEKMTNQISEVIENFSINEILTASTCKEASRTISSRAIDLVIINTPMPDETGEKFSVEVAAQNKTCVLLIVNTQSYKETIDTVQEHGIIVLEKPMTRSMLEFSIQACIATYARIKKLSTENTKLTRTIEDIRIVNRAKRVLVTHLNMSEESAHKYIERQAMDNRRTKRDVAKRIILVYENQ